MPKPASEELPDTEVEPDPTFQKRTRREFTSEYKLRIIAEADQCKNGKLVPLLRRQCCNQHAASRLGGKGRLQVYGDNQQSPFSTGC